MCLGMTVDGDRRWMILDYGSSSLYSVIADERYRSTNAGKKAWKSLIAGSSLQENCNSEGFNIQHGARLNNKYVSLNARLGFIANNENDCKSADSWIGLGVRYTGCIALFDLACGNRAVCGTAVARRNIPAFGYILVQ